MSDNAIKLTNAQLKEEADILKFRVDMAKAQESGVVAKEDPIEKAKEMASKGEHIRSAFTTEYYEDDDE